MKLVTFKVAGVTRLGAQVDGGIVDLQAADGGTDGLFANMLNLIRAGDAGLARAKDAIASGKGRLSPSDAPLLAPLLPSTILCAGSNYHAHNAEKKDSPTSGKEPEFFVKTSDCVIGPDEAILFDERLTRKLDCETELAVVMGKPGRHIPVERALDHVFGYTIVNDVTARDRQVRTNEAGFTWYELGRGKAFDTSAPLGPCIVTADEIGDPQTLELKTRINGELRQSSNTSDMIWTCAELIHFFSVNFTLRPGMVIITGTPAGTAWSTDTELGGKWRNLPGLVPATRYCLPGDVVECEMEKIGTLRNPVASA